MEEKDRILRACFLFSGASSDSLAPIVQASGTESFHRGAEIFAAEDPADGLRIVLSGQVRIWMADTQGRELTLNFLGEGDAFGEIALLDGLPRTSNASAVEATKCLFVPKSAMERAIADDPSFAQQLILSMCELMRQNLGTISGFAFEGLDSRLALALYNLAFDHAEIDGNTARFQRKFSQTDIAQLLGVTREAINKRFKALESAGLIEVEAGRIVIHDMQALSERAEMSDVAKNG